MSIQRCSPRTVTAIGSIPPGQPAFRSPGVLRSRCLDHRQWGQWLRCDVPGASSETSTPQCPHRNERGNDKSGDLSKQGSGTAQTSRLLSCSGNATTIVGSAERSVNQISSMPTVARACGRCQLSGLAADDRRLRVGTSVTYAELTGE